MKHALCILANNMDFLEAFAKNFTQGPYDLLIINETRIGNKIDTIKSIFPNATIIDSEDVVKDFAKNVVDNEFLHSYTMAMKILSIWYVFKNYKYDKVFFTDEDIFINNIDNIFEYENSVFYYFSLSAGNHAGLKANSKKYQDMIKEFNKIFDININEDNYKQEWIKKHINAGQRLYVRKDLKNFEFYLKRYFESDYIKYLWDHRRRPTTMMLDEWFESMYISKEGIVNNALNKNHQVLLLIAKPEKINFEKMNFKKWNMIHNATSTQKYKCIDLLREHNLII